METIELLKRYRALAQEMSAEPLARAKSEGYLLGCREAEAALGDEVELGEAVKAAGRRVEQAVTLGQMARAAAALAVLAACLSNFG